MARTTLEMRIDHIGPDGLGVGQSSEGRISVPGVGVGDVVDVRVDHKSPHQKHAWGTVRRVIARGGDFVQPVCHHAAPIRGRCGGCALMHLKDTAQSDAKHRWVENALADLPGYQRQAGLQQAPDANPDGLRYRNRAIYTAFRPNRGQIHLGSRSVGGEGYAKMAGCRVNAPAVEDVAAYLTEILNERHIPLYPARSGLRYVVIRANGQGDVLVELICAQKEPGWIHAVVSRLRTHSAVQGIMLSVNRSKGNAFRVEAPRRIWGVDTLDETLGDVTLRMSIDSFFQLHAEVAKDMYAAAAHFSNEARVIWDLYCGVGGLGIHVARAHSKARLFGSELNASAMELARYNAQQNGVEAQFQLTNLRRGAPKNWPKPDLVTVNPPRRGLDDAVKKLLVQTRPRQIAYMSCSPVSLQKDLRALCAAGYRLSWHGAWDMLPQTPHVETLVMLERTEGRPPRHRDKKKGASKRASAPQPVTPEDRAAKHRRRYARKKKRS